MHEYFLNHAITAPTSPAICSWDGSLTYGELLHHSDALARHLIGLGVGESSIIPLCFEKCMWTAVALLAVMRTGACFTLMDPAQPLARLQTIAEQVEAKIILVSEVHEELGRKIGQEAHVIAVGQVFFKQNDSSSNGALTYPAFNIEAPMYIQFTSGSTG
jgi:non-ribosomal peptide synthetase component F